MSPAKPRSMAELTDALLEEAKIVMNPTRPTPIISADALAAVRLGLRMAFSRASSPVMPRSLGSGAPIARLSGSDTVRPSTDTPKNTSSAPGADDQDAAGDVGEQAGEQRGHAEDQDRRADHDALLGPVAGAARGHRPAWPRPGAPWRPCGPARRPRPA